MKITLLNQSFRIELEGREELPSYVLNRYHIYSFKRNALGKKDILKRGYSYSKKENTFYFPMSIINAVIGALKVNGVKFTTADNRDTSSYEVRLKMSFKAPYRGVQKDYVDALVKMDKPTNIIEAEPGAGKALKNSELVLTPNGWVENGTLKVGDYVIGSCGNPIMVLGVYPQGIQDIYNVRFIDKTTVGCTLDHLWKVQGNGDQKPKILSTRDMLFSGVCEDTRNGKHNTDKCRYKYAIKIGSILSKQYPIVKGEDAYGIHELEENYKAITDISYTHREEATCIKVDAKDSLYVVNGYNLTHNTFMATKALQIIGERFFIIIKAGYVSKWLDDLNIYLGLDKSDIYVFTGLKSIDTWANLNNRERKKYKVLIMSTTTLSLYIQKYDSGSEVSITPSNLLKECKANVVLSDEVHQHYDSILLGVIRFNPLYVIGLSATLLHKDKRRQMMYDLLFPIDSKLSLALYKPYMNMYLVKYRFKNRGSITYKRKGFGYNQLLFEEYIVRAPDRRLMFFKMLDELFKRHYLDRKDDTDRCLFLCATRNMATMYTEHLKSKYPTLDVRRNIRDDSYEDLMEGQVIVATNGKSGTGVDLKNLFVMVNIILTDSIQSNIQFPGRLRPMKNKELRYIQIYTPDIEQHTKYIQSILSMLTYRYVKIHTESVRELLP